MLNALRVVAPIVPQLTNSGLPTARRQRSPHRSQIAVFLPLTLFVSLVLSCVMFRCLGFTVCCLQVEVSRLGSKVSPNIITYICMPAAFPAVVISNS